MRLTVTLDFESAKELGDVWRVSRGLPLVEPLTVAAELLPAPVAEPPVQEPKPPAQICCDPPRKTRRPRSEPAEDAGPIRIDTDTGRRTEQETIEAIRAAGEIRAGALADALAITAAAASQRLYKLMGKGLVVSLGQGRYALKD